MSDTFTMTNFAAYCAQVLCVTAAAGVLVALVRLDAPGVRYLCLRTTLALCLLLPWFQPRYAAAPSSDVTASVAAATAAAPPQALAATTRSAHWAPVVTGFLLTGMAARLLWLGVGVIRLRRLRSAGEPADSAEHASLQQAIGTRADVRYIAGLAQPVTFGINRAVILLPQSLRAQPAEIREAVLAHELVHVGRRDWGWVLCEEILRAVFWFHPAMWWLISRIQLAREEVVDALAVAHTGRRRAYMEALMAFADGPSTSLSAGVRIASAPAFARKRHLFRRMVLISKEDVMSAKRIVISSLAIVVMMAIGGWYAVRAFPLVEADGQILHKQPGPLETVANAITPENPVPRRVQHEPAQYPAELAAENAWVSVTLRTTIDSTGAVAEARVGAVQVKMRDIALTFEGATAANFEEFLEKAAARARPGESAQSLAGVKPTIDAAVNAAAAAVERWRYDPPANPPVSIDTTFFFAPGLAVIDTPAVPLRAVNRAGGAFTVEDGKALRVGGNVRVPIKIKDVRPIYPPEAKEARVQGVVVIEIRVDAQGRVEDAHVLRSIPMLDAAALDAVRQWEFQPTLLNGAPTPIILTVTVQFSLE
jgi:TonB family protein